MPELEFQTAIQTELKKTHKYSDSANQSDIHRFTPRLQKKSFLIQFLF